MYEVKWMPKTEADLEKLCNKAVEHGFELVACNDKFCVFKSIQQGETMYLISCEGQPKVAYPRRKQAEVYASGFSKPCEIIKITVKKEGNDDSDFFG